MHHKTMEFSWVLIDVSGLRYMNSSPLKLSNSFTKETDKILYHTHHKTDSILSGIDEHVRFMADE